MIEYRADEAEYEENEDGDKSEYRKAVAQEALDNLSRRRENLNTGDIVECDCMFFVVGVQVFFFNTSLRSYEAIPHSSSAQSYTRVNHGIQQVGNEVSEKRKNRNE